MCQITSQKIIAKVDNYLFRSLIYIVSMFIIILSAYSHVGIR